MMILYFILYPFPAILPLSFFFFCSILATIIVVLVTHAFLKTTWCPCDE